jgi:putative ABC transport system ATP-binding protein
MDATNHNPPAESNGRSLAISCRGVTKSFGGGSATTLALRGIDIDVYLGQLTMLVGPSGCGKTTLLSVLAGTLDANDGSVRVFDQELTQMSGAAKVRFRREYIGFIFQQFNLLPAMTSAENAMVPLLIAGWARRKAHARACEVLKQLGMGHRLDSFPRQLSGGQQQRVAIARALVHQPRLLICDEPTSALDAETGQTVMQLLSTAAVQSDRAVVVVTHDNRIFHFSNRTAHLEDGRVLDVRDEPPSEAVSQEPHR